MYAKALKAGALGGKISGAGGGGFLLLYCKREDQNNIRKVMKGYREMPFLLEKDGSKIIFNMHTNGNNEIFMMNPDGTDKINLTNNPAPDLWPVVQP